MRQVLLGGKLLGNGGDMVGSVPRFGDPPYYLLNDTFTTNRAAGAVNGTDAEPGPGRRFAEDTGNKLSLASGSVSFATGGVNGDPRLIYNPVDRRPGLVLIGATLHTTQGANWGFAPGPGSLVSEGLRVNGTSLSVRANSISLAVGTIATSTVYQLAVVLRTGGALHFIKGGSFTNWTLVWISSIATAAALRPAIEAIGTSSVLTSSHIRIAPERWLPAPLASDGFSVWGTSDGLGHAEGVAGGLGVGGNGLAWTQNVGTWQAASGVASASALSGGVAIATVNTSKADVIATANITRAGSSAGVVVRYVDDNNFVVAQHDGTNAQLVKRVAGVNTVLISAVATYVAGAEVRLICQGQAFRLYYNGAFIGSEQTIADAGLQSGTRQGLRTTDTGNTFDDFVVRARGSGGEYAALDAF